MKFWKIILGITFVFSFTQKASAQIDTVFYFAAPWLSNDHTNADSVAFHFATFNQTTTIRLYQPAGTYDTTFTVLANSVFSKSLKHIISQVISKPANTILTSGFKIVASKKITVVYDIITRAPTFFNPETFSLKGLNGMGNEFVLPYQTKFNNAAWGDSNGDGLAEDSKQQFSIVATKPNTTIYITPRCAIVGHPAGVTFSVLLPFEGSVWVGQNITRFVSVAGSNMSGTIVVSNKPVSVTCTDDSVAAPAGCRDAVGDQIVPTDVIGNEYISLKGGLNSNQGESIYVVATENFTTVVITPTIGPIVTQLLNQGDTYMFDDTTARTYIKSTKPVYVFHMSGYGCELGGALLPPLNCAGSDTVNFVRSNPQTFICNILCKTGTQGSFVMNGSAALVPAAAFTNVPGTLGVWMSAQISYTLAQIPVGSIRLRNSMDLFSLGVINGGTTTGALYHYLSSFTRKVVTKAGNDVTVCNSQSVINLVGSVSGGATTGIWTPISGTGVLNNPTNLITTYIPTPGDFAQGNISFVLTSTGNCNPVKDTVKFTFLQSPVAFAGPNQTFCKNNVGAIPISGFSQFATGGTWSGGVGGSFALAGSLSTTYTPSPTDLTNGSVQIVLTTGASTNPSCLADTDTLIISFTNPPAVDAGPNQVVCANSTLVNLNGIVSGASSTGVWTSSGSGVFANDNVLNTTYTLSQVDTINGSVVLTLFSTNNGNCLPSSTDMTITIIDKPTITISTPDTICSNVLALPLNGTVSLGYSLLWSTTGLGSIANTSNPNTFYNLSALDPGIGYIDVILSTNGGSCPVESDTLRVILISLPIVDAGSDVSFCANELVQVSGTVSGAIATGSWVTSGSGVFSPGSNFLTTTYQPSQADLNAGSVTLILSSQALYSCLPVPNSLLITFLDIPNALFTAPSACQEENVSFTDQSTTASGTISSWLWDFGDFQPGSATQNPLHPYSGSGAFPAQLIVTNSLGCSDTTIQDVNVNPLPVAGFISKDICVDQAGELFDVTFLASGTIGTWNYVTNQALNSTDQNPVFIFTNVGDVIITQTVTSTVGCVGIFVDTLYVNPKPIANFSINPIPALALETVQFTDLSIGGNINNWIWDFGDQSGDVIQNPEHAYASGGIFPVELNVTDSNGCKASKIINMNVALLPVLPLAFTPNGDNENDILLIRQGPFYSVDFKVYNNWGELVYQGNDWQQGWDGNYLGQPAAMGVYTWTFSVELVEGRFVKKSGDVTLIR